jgi:polyisoprenoid-binding protein YceI
MFRLRFLSRLTRNSVFACLAAISAGAASWVGAAPVTYRIDPDLTSAEFSVSHLGLSRQRGHFGHTVGTIVIDPEWHRGAIELDVDATSVDTGWGVRDAFLRSEDMFDTARYPVVTFRSTQLTFAGEKLIGIAGKLSMHNVTRPVQLKIVRLDCGTDPADGREGCGAEAVTSVSRSEFGMNFAPGLIGDQIDLSFQVTAFRAPETAATSSP